MMVVMMMIRMIDSHDDNDHDLSKKITSMSLLRIVIPCLKLKYAHNKFLSVCPS